VPRAKRVVKIRFWTSVILEKRNVMTEQHSHRFVEEYEGLVGFGLDRETDEHTLTYYLQKFSDDELMALIRHRLTDEEMEELFNLLTRLMNQLSQEGTVVQEKEIVRLKDHQVTLAQDQKETRKKLEEIYAASGLKPPYVKEWKNDFPGNTGPEVLEVMVKDGALIKATEELYFHKSAIEGLEGRLVDFLKTHGEITTPQFKDLTGASRKYAIPLVEYFDRNQVTVRVGDSRVLRKK